MKINGYELNVSEEFLDDIFANKTREVKLVDKNFAGYQALTEGNKKALEHLVAAAKIFDEAKNGLNFIGYGCNIDKKSVTLSHLMTIQY